MSVLLGSVSCLVRIGYRDGLSSSSSSLTNVLFLFRSPARCDGLRLWSSSLRGVRPPSAPYLLPPSHLRQSRSPLAALFARFLSSRGSPWTTTMASVLGCRLLSKPLTLGVAMVPSSSPSRVGTLISRLKVAAQTSFRGLSSRPFFTPCVVLGVIASAHQKSLLSSLFDRYRRDGLVVNEPSTSSPPSITPSGLSRKEEPFDWPLFFSLLKADLLGLVMAILSAVVAAWLNLKISSALGEVVNIAAGKLGKESLYQPAMRLCLLYAFQGFMTFVYITTLSFIGERFAERLRNKVFEAVTLQGIEFFDTTKSAEMLTRLTDDVQSFKSSFKKIISKGVKNIVQVGGSLVSMVIISPHLTLVLGLFVPIVITGGTVFGSLLRALSRRTQKMLDEQMFIAHEIIGNIKTVRASATEDAENAKFQEKSRIYRNMSIFFGAGIGAFRGFYNLFINAIVLIVLYRGGILLSDQKLSPGSLMAFLVNSQSVQKSLADLSALFSEVVRGASAGGRVFDLLHLTPSPTISRGVEIDVKGHIEFKNVHFIYPSRPDQVVFDDLCLEIPAGRVVALCGHSGSGKSTIANLIERFYDPTSGEVLIDGHALPSLDTRWFRQHVVAYISQEPVLFHATIFENIRYGRPNATPEQVEEAARQANAHEFITSFPSGYDTLVGERGAALSGGQKQRIAIARALLRDPAILVLDEATSALDAQSERLVQEAIERMVRGRTTLIIAHRLSTIKNADIIMVMQRGRVVEQGSHDELVQKKGFYADLIHPQNDIVKALPDDATFHFDIRHNLSRSFSEQAPSSEDSAN